MNQTDAENRISKRLGNVAISLAMFLLLLVILALAYISYAQSFFGFDDIPIEGESGVITAITLSVIYGLAVFAVKRFGQIRLWFIPIVRWWGILALLCAIWWSYLLWG